MTDVDKLLRELSSVARTEGQPTIDVRQSVLETLSTQTQTSRIDLTPVAFAGVAIAAAAIVVIAFLPSWQAMSDPWVCLLP